MKKELYEFTEDCVFDDPNLGSKVHYRAGDREEFYPKQVKYMRHAIKLVQDAPAPKKKAKGE